MTKANWHQIRNYILRHKDYMSSFLDVVELACHEFKEEPEEVGELIRKDRTLFLMIREDCSQRKMIKKRPRSQNLDTMFENISE